VPDKPSYLGILNALCVGEAGAARYLTAWIEKTEDPEVREVLTKVCHREAEHAAAFAKRINELGFSVREKHDKGMDKACEIASSDLSDLEKMEKLHVGEELNVFDTIFTDHTIDVQTGALLGRYIAEEHDTNRMTRACRAKLAARQNGSSGTSQSDELAHLSKQVDELCQAVDELRQIVSGKTKAARS